MILLSEFINTKYTTVMASKNMANGDVITLNVTNSITDGAMFSYFEVMRNGVGVFDTSTRDITSSLNYAISIYNDIE